MSDLLRILSDSELLSRTRDLVALERAVTLRLLLHLNEIERRQLHLAQGYSSMFDYCTSGLGYSEPAAYRRIRSARCIADFPEVYQLLKSNLVSLNSIARVSRVLTTDNKDVLLKRIRGCSQREVEGIVAEYEPRDAVRDVVRSVVLRGTATPLALPEMDRGSSSQDHLLNDAAKNNSASNTEQRLDDCEKSNYLRGEGNFHPTSIIVRRVQFHFSTSKEFQQKLEKVKALAWHRLPANASLEHVLELALDAFIERNDPVARRERRKQRAATKAKKEDSAQDPAPTSSDGRRIPVEIRDEVFARDRGRCAFVGKDCRRCEATVGLQVDHIVPVARGGASTLDNLRLLCAQHNRFKTDRLMPPGQQDVPD